jgi:hypothetical protein
MSSLDTDFTQAADRRQRIESMHLKLWPAQSALFWWPFGHSEEAGCSGFYFRTYRMFFLTTRSAF